MFKDEDL